MESVWKEGRIILVEGKDEVKVEKWKDGKFVRREEMEGDRKIVKRKRGESMKNGQDVVKREEMEENERKGEEERVGR